MADKRSASALDVPWASSWASVFSGGLQSEEGCRMKAEECSLKYSPKPSSSSCCTDDATGKPSSSTFGLSSSDGSAGLDPLGVSTTFASAGSTLTSMPRSRACTRTTALCRISQPSLESSEPSVCRWDAASLRRSSLSAPSLLAFACHA